MGRRRTMGRDDLLDSHPDAPRGFMPTHVVVRDDRMEFVRCVQDGRVAWALRPGEDEPAYAVTPTGIWQSLERHEGRVRARAILYTPDYQPPGARPGEVYFLQEGEDGPVKVGWSGNPERRRAQLQVANSTQLRLLGTRPGTMADESRIHRELTDHRVHGEWFEPGPAIAYLEKS